ncbi:UNVERIFIED_CONTAM: hypothetical protein RMT77_002659 [Armadillidium vulgare]
MQVMRSVRKSSRGSMRENPPRKRSVIYNGYPSEDILIERRQEESEDHTEVMRSVGERVPESTSATDRFRRPSFLAEYLRCSPEGESVNGENSYQECTENHHHISCSQSLIKKYFGDLENRLFDVFGDRNARTINVFKFFSGLLETGLRLKDPRLREMVEGLRKMQDKFSSNEERSLQMDYDAFLGIISHNLEIIVKAFSNSFIIPDFLGFAQRIDEIYYTCKKNKNGQVASYIPQLSRVSKDMWGVSICTVDGQRHSIGDVNVPFTIQSCSKPMTYAIAAGECSPTYFHSFVGMEPSGRYFNELCLDHNNKPHNPMINAGAIMTAALIKPELSSADRFDYVFNEYKRLCGGEYLGFNNSVFLSERECADRNFALAYFMRENKCFPEGTKINEVLDFYFQLCSLEITAESGAVIAATLANGGINPLTGEAVLTVEAVRNTLTLMHSCGMYNYSGQFAFKVGLPAKSGVSGSILLVVPNTLGICLWSPPLDSNGNSCRGVQFCMELVTKFKFHHFDNLRGHIGNKIDPRIGKNESKAQILFDVLFSVAAGDLSSLKRHAMLGTDLNSTDYDGRTALHVAASEGHEDIVEFLLDKCGVETDLKDRWGRTALEDAKQFEHTLCVKLIEKTIHLRQLNVDFAASKTQYLKVPSEREEVRPPPLAKLSTEEPPNLESL